jgi:hypothetical protein
VRLQPAPEAAYVKALQELREHAVRDENRTEPGEICGRQRLQPERWGERGEGQPDAARDDHQRQECDGQCSRALDEGDLLGSDHLRDECLRQQAFDEPAGLEQRLVPERVGAEGKRSPPRSSMPSTVKGGSMTVGLSAAAMLWNTEGAVRTAVCLAFAMRASMVLRRFCKPATSPVVGVSPMACSHQPKSAGAAAQSASPKSSPLAQVWSAIWRSIIPYAVSRVALAAATPLVSCSPSARKRSVTIFCMGTWTWRS